MFEVDNILERSKVIRLSAESLITEELYQKGIDIYEKINKLKKAYNAFNENVYIDYDLTVNNLDFSIEEEFNDFKTIIERKGEKELEDLQTNYLHTIVDYYELDITYHVKQRVIREFPIYDNPDEAIYKLKKLTKIKSFDTAKTDIAYNKIKDFKTKHTNKIVKFMCNDSWISNGQLYSPEKITNILIYINHLYPEVNITVNDLVNDREWIYDKEFEFEGAVEKIKLFQNNNFKITFNSKEEALKFNQKFNQ